MIDHQQLDQNGFLHIPGVFSVDEIGPALTAAHKIHQVSQGWDFQQRAGNIRFFNAQEPSGHPSLRSVLWCALLDPALEHLRRDPRLLQLVQALLGDDVRQVTNQLHYKFAHSQTSFALHSDQSSRVRAQKNEIQNLETCFYQTAILLGPMNQENGGVYFVPGSHKWSHQTEYAASANPNQRPEQDFAETMPEGCVAIEGQAGDVLIWHGGTVHGSALSRAQTGCRILYVNGFVRAQDSWRGYWALLQGQPAPLPAIDVPVLVYGEPDFRVFDAPAARALLTAYQQLTG